MLPSLQPSKAASHHPPTHLWQHLLTPFSQPPSTCSLKSRYAMDAKPPGRPAMFSTPSQLARSGVSTGQPATSAATSSNIACG